MELGERAQLFLAKPKKPKYNHRQLAYRSLVRLAKKLQAFYKESYKRKDSPTIFKNLQRRQSDYSLLSDSRIESSGRGGSGQEEAEDIRSESSQERSAKTPLPRIDEHSSQSATSFQRDSEVSSEGSDKAPDIKDLNLNFGN